TAPADIADLTTTTVTGSTIALAWTAPGDDATTGTAAVYDIRYSPSTITPANWALAIPVTTEPVPQLAGTTEAITVTDLASETTYYFAIKSTDESANTSNLSNLAQATTLDISAPTISHISSGTPSTTSVAITWDTDEPATTQVSYGTTVAYGYYSTLDETLLTTHTVLLTDLTPETNYHFQVISEDAATNSAVSSDQNFTTTVASDTTDTGGESQTSAQIIIPNVPKLSIDKIMAPIVTAKKLAQRVEIMQNPVIPETTISLDEENDLITISEKILNNDQLSQAEEEVIVEALNNLILTNYDQTEDFLVLKGKSAPLSTIAISIENKNIVNTVRCDSDGLWEYKIQLNSFSPGTYQINMKSMIGKYKGNQKGVMKLFREKMPLYIILSLSIIFIYLIVVVIFLGSQFITDHKKHRKRNSTRKNVRFARRKIKHARKK
ncbi:MAG: peptidase families S8 and S53 protein, partial [uncultured bacterium]